jgi:AcrR family transcriptional regulator
LDSDATASRILDAARRQIELFGIRRTTMEDIARRSGISRVTVYRHFPTKDRLVEAVVLREVHRFLAELGALLDQFDSEEDRIIEGFVFTVGALRQHSLLQRLLHGEPELFLPQLTIEAGPILALARTLIVDYVKRRGWSLLSDDELSFAAETGVRLALSLVLTPDSFLDLDDPDRLRKLARHYLAPFADGEVLHLVIAKTTKPSKRR